MKERISLTMIVKNESANLVACLESVKNAVDEIIIVDTGSTDDTVSIAQSYTPNIYMFPWNNDFSAARNFAINHASGDWILAMDADEEMHCQDPFCFHSLLNKENDKEAFLLPLYNPILDSADEFNTFYVLRLFKNNGCYQYVGKIHEQISLPDQQKVGFATSPILKHKSLPLKVRHQKRNRNLLLLKRASQENPNDPFLEYYLGVEWLMLGKAGYALPFLQKAYHSLTDNNLLFRAPILKYLLISLRVLGRLDEALSLCLEASLNYPKFTDNFFLGGLLLEEKGEYPIALKWFKQAIDCGTPPALFSHLTGSESFLAYYHLGFCYEKISNNAAAQEAYESALKLNPKYHCPLYPLFLNLLNEKGPALCFQHLNNQGFLNDPLLCLTSADLFFLSGNVDQSYRCLKILKVFAQDDDRFLYSYGKYCIYSGRTTAGLETLNHIIEQSSYSKSAQILSIIALIHLGQLLKAKSLAITLWKDLSTRNEATVLLYLIRFMQKGPIPFCLSKVREKETLTLTNELFLDCKRYRSFNRISNPLVDTLNQGLENLMKSSEKGLDLLLKNYTQLLKDYNNCFVAKFKNGWLNDEY